MITHGGLAPRQRHDLVHTVVLTLTLYTVQMISSRAGEIVGLTGRLPYETPPQPFFIVQGRPSLRERCTWVGMVVGRVEMDSA